MKITWVAAAVAFIAGSAIGAAVVHCTGGEITAETGSEAQSLELGSVTRGEITQSSQMNLKDGTRFQAYQFTPDKAGVVKIQQSGVLAAQLTLFNQYRDLVQMPFSSMMYIQVDESEIGEPMTLVVSGAQPSSYGPFRLNTSWLELNTDSVLSIGEERAAFLVGEPGRYDIQIEQAGVYQFDMISEHFDAYLRLSGVDVALSDDDGGEGLNARLHAYLEPGDYQLYTTSVYDNGDGIYGPYTVAMQQAVGMDELYSGRELVIGAPIEAYLNQSSRDFIMHVAEPAHLRIGLESDFFDTVLDIVGPQSFYDDDGGEGTNSLVSGYFPVGNYIIQVKPFGNGSGVFSLSAIQTDL